MKKKFDYEAYKDKYDESFLKKMETSPTKIKVKAMKEQLYGCTYTEDYARGEVPDQFSMDYWSEKKEDGSLEANLDPVESIACQMELDMSDGRYKVETVQEKRLLEAIDSTGDGKTPETALYVIEVFQEYEYISRVYPYCTLQRKRQFYRQCVDCIEFLPNDAGIERIYFNISRRFEVGH